MNSYFEPRFHEYLDDNSPVSWGGQKYSSGLAFNDHAPKDYQANLTAWVQDQKVEARIRVREILESNGCLQRFNRLAERHTENQILPFVGAGMSKPSGFPLWGDFLEQLAQNDSELLARVKNSINEGQFSDAAQHICEEYSENMLGEQVENFFGTQILDPRGPVCLLPEIFRIGCITTNFDNVLEEVYKRHGAKFAQIYSGTAIIEAPRQTTDNGHVLFKIHGSATTRLDRVLTTDEYDRAYGETRTVHGTLNSLTTNRSILFMGCRLATDRTIAALQEIKKMNGVTSLRHYAFLPDPGQTERSARHTEMDKAEIHPIWYPVINQNSDHDMWIEDFLLTLDDGPL